MTTRTKGVSGPRTVSYLRVSTDQQNTEKNKVDVAAFCNQHDWPRVEFVEETASGVKSWKDRKIAALIDELKEGDRLILPELSRLGRSSLEIMTMLQALKERKVSVYDVKNNWSLDGSLQSEVLAFAFSISARIERDLMLARTSEGRRRSMEKGVVRWGRPPGTGKSKLDAHREEIAALLKTGSRQTYLCKKYKCSGATLSHYLKKHKISTKPVYDCTGLPVVDPNTK